MTPQNAYLCPLDPLLSHRIPISDRFTIGRAPDANLRLTTKDIANLHARIVRRGDQYLISTLNPEVRVLVNGCQVLNAYIQNGDAIQIGLTHFNFLVIKNSDDEPQKEGRLSKNLEWDVQLKALKKMAKTEFPILLSGESGAGKDVVAQHIHQFSKLRSGPFITINCSAISSNLLESELFGHVKGSFTGALSDRKGAFESARGGTLFLDEIGDLPIEMQPKLLRAIENQEIRPVGSDQTIQTKVRIISASHKDLHKLVQNGLFRLDLLYRLNVLSVKIPALRERPEDIKDLIYLFAKKYSVRFSHEAIELLCKYSWPGNIRELKNLVAKTSALFPRQYIREFELSRVLPAIHSTTITLPAVNRNKQWIQQAEKELIIERLRANRGNQRKTAADLGLPKSTLHDRIRTYNIDVKALKRIAQTSKPLQLVSGL